MSVERLKNQPLLLIATGALAGLIAIIATALIVADGSGSDVVVVYGPGATEITVEVRGAVQTPGVVTLPAGARVADAIDATGGFTEAADLALINRARRLDDGELLVIPERIEQASPVSVAAVAETPDASRIQGISYRIDINRASQADLESLPGIGPVIAARIIDYRTRQGPFTEPEQLLEIEGISANLLEEIQPLITIEQ